MGLFPPYTGPSYEYYHDIDPVPNYALPYGFQPVPIHTIKPDTDYVLRGFDNCKKYKSYLENILYPSQTIKDKQEEKQDLLDTLSNAFNETITLDTLNRNYKFKN